MEVSTTSRQRVRAATPRRPRARSSGARWAATSLVVLGLALTGCGGPATGRRAAAPRETSSARTWYEVVSHAPGPELTDAAMRREVADSGHPWKVRDLATGIEMVLVLPGEFLMGSPGSEPGREENEGPRHRVRLTKAFYLGATEVTQAQWQRVTGASQGFFAQAEKPADGSWDDLQAFLSVANQGAPEGTAPLRAPTEAEWEYACRAGTTGPFAFEGPVGHELLNHNDGVVDSPYVDGRLKVEGGRLVVSWERPPSEGCRMSTAVAGSLPPNAWGLHEMHGNLAEWTADRYSAEAYADRGAVTVDPLERAADGDLHSLRGGDWYSGAGDSRSAAREPGAPTTRSNRIGFRVARTL